MSLEIVSIVALRQPLEYLNHGIDDQAFVLGGHDLTENSACADARHSFQAPVLDTEQIEAMVAGFEAVKNGGNIRSENITEKRNWSINDRYAQRKGPQ